MTSSATLYRYNSDLGFNDIVSNDAVVSSLGLPVNGIASKLKEFSLNNWVTDLLESNIKFLDNLVPNLNFDNLFLAPNNLATAKIPRSENSLTRSVNTALDVVSDEVITVFNSNYYPEFKREFLAAGIDDESIDILALRVETLLKINRVATLSMIQDIYLESREKSELDVNTSLKILRIINRFEYQDMRPFSQLIVESAIHTDNPKIQLDGLRVIDRWGNQEALNLLEKMDCPSHPWVKVKFKTLINILRNGLSKGA